MNPSCAPSSWVEIDLDALAGNVQTLKAALGPNVLLLAMVKANAYGHGVIPVARTALQHGASWLGVATIGEGLQLREAGIAARILVVGYVAPDDVALAVRFGLTLTVNEWEQAEALARASQSTGYRQAIHVKVDTGMSRYGLPVDQAIAFVERLRDLSTLRLEGIYTHLATADDPASPFAEEQIGRFLQVIKELERRGASFPLRHVAASAAVMRLPEAQLDMVRIGIALYGLFPSSQVGQHLPLRPVMAWKSRVARVAEIEAGTPVSYGCTYVASDRRRIALIPVGYADGFKRAFSNRGMLLLRGKRVPVVGRVCMDQCVADATEVPEAAVGDEVVIIGEQGSERIAADDLATLLGSINYEVVTTVGPRVQRLYRRGADLLTEGQA